MITVEEHAALPMHSRAWFQAAFEGLDVPDYVKTVAAHICKVYDIRGQANPGHIAQLVAMYTRRKPTPCTVSATGEHYNHSEGEDACIWCWDMPAK